MKCIAKFGFNPFKAIISLFTSPVFIFLILTLGLVVRLRHYLAHCSLWMDEAWVAVETVNFSVGELIRMKFYNPPLGFSLLCKMFVALWGDHEYALRALPLASGMGALIVFYYFGKNVLSRSALIVALLLFSLSDALIQYSAELKPYATDVGLALVLFALAERVRKNHFAAGWMWVLGFVGAISLWISSPAIFVLGGIGITWIAFAFVRREWRQRRAVVVACALWGWSFLLLYWTSLRHVTQNDDLLAMWQASWAPEPLWSAAALVWIGRTLGNFFVNPGGFWGPGVAIFMFLTGCYVMGRRDPERLGIFFLPLPLTLLATMVHKYPFQGRVALFLVPLMILGIAQGVAFLLEHRLRRFQVLGIAVSLALLFPSTYTLAQRTRQARCPEYNREMMVYFKDRYQPGDFLVFNTGALYPFWYYAGNLRITSRIPKELHLPWKEKGHPAFRVGKFYDSLQTDPGGRHISFVYDAFLYDEQGRFKTAYALSPLYPVDETRSVPDFPSGRVWLIVSHVSPGVKELALKVFDQKGKRVMQFERSGEGAYLYNFYTP